MGVRKLFDHTADGDNHLSSFEIGLWNLTYDCLIRFSCPVIFRVTGPNAPRRIDQVIEFFVPMRNARCADVVEFLRGELKHETMPPQVVGNEYHWGRFVHVREFDGLYGYTDHATSQEMAQIFMADIMERLAAKKDEKKQ